MIRRVGLFAAYIHVHVHVNAFIIEIWQLLTFRANSFIHTRAGQFYTVILKANISTTLPDQVKSVVSLTFFDEPDKRIEFGHWQYWYNLQANPNQKAFDIGEAAPLAMWNAFETQVTRACAPVHVCCD